MPMEKKDFEPAVEEKPKKAETVDEAAGDAEAAAAQKALDALYAKNNLPADVDPSTYVAPSAYLQKGDVAEPVDAPPIGK